LRILVVSSEYPPMKGGVGRYTYNLVNALKRRNNIDIFIAMSNRKNNTTTTTTTTATSLSDSNSPSFNNGIYYNIVNKGDKQNSDRLLNLIDELKPDIVNIQYERGIYEIDTTIRHMARRLIYGSTLDKFYKLCPVPTVSTLHTVLHYNEYHAYIKELALKKVGRLAALPRPLRAAIRRLVFEKRYNLLLEIINLSKEIISLAKSNQALVKRGTVIYHGAESASSLSAQNKDEYKREFGLPTDKKLLLAFGYVGSYKGFDILSNLKLPDDWSLVIKQNKHERGIEQPVHIKNAINLHLGYLDDLTLSKLFFACDAIIFPYVVVSISGVLFDALAHGLPFVASDLSFFQEFAQMDLGITCRRDAKSFSDSLMNLATNYEKYHNNVLNFNPKLKWDNIADNYINFFSKILNS
jgi:glycosyltransferase involved in cell wall biosynthesis